MSKRDQILLFSRDLPLSRQQSAIPQQANPQGTAPSWAKSLNNLVMTTTTGISDITHKVEKIAHDLVPARAGSEDDFVHLKAEIIIQKKLLVLDLTDLIADSGDDLAEVLGQHVTVQLVGTTIDPKTGKGAVSSEVAIQNWVTTADVLVPENFKFKMDFKVPKDFGTPGAIIVKNRHVHEFLLQAFAIQTPDGKVTSFVAESWVYNTNLHGGRIFFSNQMYLPGDTPAGLVPLRQQELQNLRGDGTGERKFQDRIYDYDTYNDLGDADLKASLKRPPLGGSQELPYPRRVRTGRPMSKKDPKSESRGSVLTLFYLPRDERFDQVKASDFAADALRSQQHRLLPTVKALGEMEQEFDNFADIKSLYSPQGKTTNGMSNLVPAATDSSKTTPNPKVTVQDPLAFVHEYAFPSGPDTSGITFPLPRVIEVDDKSWSTDVEFAREMLAGLNPMVIQLVKEFPMTSKLDPAQFGDALSAITAKHIEDRLEGLTVDQAVAQKKLFTLDYHDIYLPYVTRINAQKLGLMYATRTVLFLGKDGTLAPLAIELTLPPTKAGGNKISRVFTAPKPDQSETDQLWNLAKAHVLSNDSSFHEVISHWMRTHAAMEPFIIATARQLSTLHPVHRVIVPHYKNTMDINAAARKALINAGGIIESTFTPGAFAMELSAVVYKLDWRFDEQALPADLIKRGMAVPDANAPHGLKLVIEDYPYAVDGLEIWAALKTYMTDHLQLFYKDDSAVQDDVELQSWWTELRTVGHGDKKDAEGWPVLNSVENLAQTLTTIAWVASCHHAAVNFGQYEYAGFMPNHPSMTRKFVPEVGTKEWDDLQKDPERFYLDTVSNETQATTVMSTIEILATHALDEEYLGQRSNPNWSSDPKVLSAFDKFTNKIGDIEKLIQSRNADKSLKNRSGPVQIPYELLFPTSGPGLTGKGVPNSVSI
jgi:hypothetical protein